MEHLREHGAVTAPSTLTSVTWTLGQAQQGRSLKALSCNTHEPPLREPSRCPDMIPFPHVFDGDFSSAPAATGSGGTDLTEPLGSGAMARLQELQSISGIGSTEGKH